LLGKLQKQQILSHPKDISGENQYETSLTDADFKDDIDMDELNDMVKEQKYVIQNFGKQFADKILLVFDDCISSKLLKSRVFRQLVFNSCHVNISMIINKAPFILPLTTRRVLGLFVPMPTLPPLANVICAEFVLVL
jgi:hypothetical protein